MIANELPRFTQHAANKKNAAIDREFLASYVCNPEIELILSELTTRGRSPGSIRILDFGCGRGELVLHLRSRGFDAAGVDVKEAYLRNGVGLLPDGAQNVLTPIDSAGRTIHADRSFDLVVSDQVIEHVVDLRRFATEVSRVTRIGGRGLHIFPPKTSLLEVHLKMPLIHWLPAGPLRRRLIQFALRCDIGVGYFSGYSLAQRAMIFESFLDSETAYRRVSTVCDVLNSVGLSASVTQGMQYKCKATRNRVLRTLFGLPVLGRVIATIYCHFRVAYIATTREGAAASR